MAQIDLCEKYFLFDRNTGNNHLQKKSLKKLHKKIKI